ncbi:winged helix-turn-helix domain-containing protein [Oceanicella sp. SM1341]|uniref:winged helix-turn-helix domain-containing protein n=1 Tax=Oceanicella sp. SM1341 TaxID=1548889 RepID=UPI000E49739D|nr:LysR family transcriptional regulator [Oceanicella sp. SM1341]
MTREQKHSGMRIRFVFGPEAMIGPGKADLLQAIAATGSISAAGKGMGMSYKRAWSLVEAMNAEYAGPVVETSRGGASRGGAALTPLGEKVLGLYRRLQEKAEAATRAEVAELKSVLSDMSGGK